MKRITCLLALFSLLCLGADFSGKWSGTAEVKRPDGSTETDPAFLILKQDGNKLTGSAGENEEHQFELRNALIDGNTLKGEITTDGGRVFTLELTLSGDDLNGEAKTVTDEGTKITAVVKLTRVK